jgi:hypothetical protein
MRRGQLPYYHGKLTLNFDHDNTHFSRYRKNRIFSPRQLIEQDEGGE